MSKNPPVKVVGPYKCVGARQIAAYVRAMIGEKQANVRAKYASHALLLLDDVDKATLEGAASADRALALGQIAEEQEGLLKLIAETGIVTIPTNQDEPLSLGGTE